MQPDVQSSHNEPASSGMAAGPVIDASPAADGNAPAAAAETTAKEAADRAVQAEAARSRAVQLMNERRFAEARKALEEAESIEAGPSRYAALKERGDRLMTAVKSRIPKRSKSGETELRQEPATALGPVEKSLQTVKLFSKIAAVVGLLPGGLLNFAAILAVQITMVWKIANNFGHTEGKDKIRGSILSLIGAIIPTGIGHGLGVAIAAIPAVIAGTLVYFLVTPVLAYALTQAVGKAFIMHFESGGTLLTFDPEKFQEYFLNEFKAAGGTVKPAPVEAPGPAPVAAPAAS